MQYCWKLMSASVSSPISRVCECSYSLNFYVNWCKSVSTLRAAFRPKITKLKIKWFLPPNNLRTKIPWTEKFHIETNLFYGESAIKLLQCFSNESIRTSITVIWYRPFVIRISDLSMFLLLSAAVFMRALRASFFFLLVQSGCRDFWIN